MLLLMTLIGWIITKIQEHNRKPIIPEQKVVSHKGEPGYTISREMWERCKGVNPTGKYNDIC